jgi:Antitoxin VbhA
MIDDDDPKPAITAEEMQRRAHVRIAIADNRMEGIPISRATQEICDLYIRGEIEARDLVAAYVKKRRGP